MAHTYEELKHKTIAELRDIAKAIDHEAVKGYSQLNKERLIAGLCKAFNIDAHVHHHHEVVGIDKPAIKARIRDLKKKRDEILASKTRDGLTPVLRQIHSLKRTIRRATI